MDAVAVSLRDALLAMLTTSIWGGAFVAIGWGLESFTPAQLTALRFLVAALPVFFLPRPKISWFWIFAIGFTLFSAQFLLLFFAYEAGMPAGLASITQQTQAFFTVALASLFLGDHPSWRQGIGMAVAFSGLALIALTTGADLTLLGLALAIAGAFSWAVGNVLTKRTHMAEVLPLMVWCSLVAPWPALAVSALVDTGPNIVDAVAQASWRSLLSVVYLGTIGTVLTYWIWGTLLRRYSTSVVAPFALLVPVTGIVGSALAFDETFPPLRYAGMALIALGLAVVVLPARWLGLTPEPKTEQVLP